MSNLQWQTCTNLTEEMRQMLWNSQNCFMGVISEVDMILLWYAPMSLWVCSRLLWDLLSAAAVAGTSSYSPFASKNALYSLIPFAVVFIGSTLFALQQLSGINAVFYFSSTVFKSAGVPSDLANVFVGIANLSGMVLYLGSIPCIYCNTVLSFDCII